MIDILIQTISRMLLLPLLMIAAAVLIKGYAAVGDGFNAGIIAATAVLLQYIAFGYERAEATLPFIYTARPLAVAGLLIVLLVAFAPMLRGDALLSHMPPPSAHVIRLGTLELHTAVLFDVGIAVVVFSFTVNTVRMVARADGDGQKE